VNRRIGPIVTALVAAALLALLGYGLAKQGPSRALDAAVEAGRQPSAPHVSQALPVLDRLRAQRAAISHWRGGVIVVNFWASWCTTCDAEEPLLERTQRALQAGHKGTVLGITYKDVSSYSLSAIERYGLSFPNLRDADGSFAAAYGTAQLPETFVLNSRLHVVAISRGPIPQAAWLARAISAAEA
jgi:cytochrome c biogenesis protein CcmG, thiol:disulfide interchange protein DsbE